MGRAQTEQWPLQMLWRLYPQSQMFGYINKHIFHSIPQFSADFYTYFAVSLRKTNGKLDLEVALGYITEWIGERK